MSYISSEELMAWTISLTQARSIVGSSTEIDSVLKIQEILQQVDYFKAFPDHIKIIQTPNDRLNRISLMAMVETKPAVENTLVLIGHTDTVEVDDYGDLKDLATEPEALMAALAKRQLSAEVRRDLESGDYLFGRGIFDMKSGTANQMALLANYSQIRFDYPGRLVLMAVSDEEGESSGMLACVEELARLTKQKGWQLTGLINTDYTTELYPGDPKRYIYTGTVGKLMPSFYIRGKEGHAGDPFAGLDANQITSYLVKDLDLNMDFCDEFGGEVAAPMISLKQADLKAKYSVQLAHEATVYFNYSTYSKSPSQVMDLCLDRARKVAGQVEGFLQEQWLNFCRSNRLPAKTKSHYQIEVISYSELLDQVAKQEKVSPKELVYHLLEEVKEEVVKTGDHTDSRTLTFALVRALETKHAERRPRIVCFFCPPFYPHNHQVKANSKLHQAVQKAIQYFSSDREPLVLKQFYPYISDLSFVSLPENDRYEEDLVAEMPSYGLDFGSTCRTYKLPFEAMRYLNLPVYDIGVYGKDAHQWSERVYKPYSFETLPKVLLSIVKNLFDNNSDHSL